MDQSLITCEPQRKWRREGRASSLTRQVSDERLEQDRAPAGPRSRTGRSPDSAPAPAPERLLPPAAIQRRSFRGSASSRGLGQGAGGGGRCSAQGGAVTSAFRAGGAPHPRGAAGPGPHGSALLPARGRCARAAAPCPPGGAPRAGAAGGAEGAAASGGSRGRHAPRPLPAAIQRLLRGTAALLRVRHRHSSGSPRPHRDRTRSRGGTPAPRRPKQEQSGSARVGPSARPGAAPPVRGHPGPHPSPNSAPRPPSEKRLRPGPLADTGRTRTQISGPGSRYRPHFSVSSSAQRSERRSHPTPGRASTAPSGAGADPPGVMGGAEPAQNPLRRSGPSLPPQCDVWKPECRRCV
ncbi:translation initiation factor IF-2-like [Motacilla alba alba]|uniref:translation initiation factor IF-2-like n=1 Tax=Motacilla alba alba TaxID=1094192 RepID=UPI0018D5A53C|nr:translation initiation factor IF-2-like [Motacilla alba alba]